MRMAVAQQMSEQEYERFVLSGVEGVWELHDGRLVEKPGMSRDHGRIVSRLARQLLVQLDEAEYEVRINEGRVRKPADTIFIPDLLVVPTAYGAPFRDRPVLAILADPLPLVVEIWSPSTGAYDSDSKVPVYQQRGDLEIWRLHPYDCTLTRWVRQPDGSYVEDTWQEGSVSPVALTGVIVDLDRLFAR
jgi:Uma2 family endonuclease